MAEEKATKIKKKGWYQIVAPAIFRETVLGETLVAEPQLIIGKRLKINLMSLTNDSKQQNVNVKFEVDAIKGDKAYSQIIGYELIPATIRRLVRRGKKRMDISFSCETSDKRKIRVKPLLITKKTMKSSVNSAIRKTITDYLTTNIKKMNYDNLISNLVSHRLQYSLRDSIKKIYPLRICEIREMHIEKEVAPEEKVKELIKPKEKKKEVKEEEAPKEAKKEDSGAEKQKIKEEKPEAEEAKPVVKKEEKKPEPKKEKVKKDAKEEASKEEKK